MYVPSRYNTLEPVKIAKARTRLHRDDSTSLPCNLLALTKFLCAEYDENGSRYREDNMSIRVYQLFGR
jgi:hypothetical protein